MPDLRDESQSQPRPCEADIAAIIGDSLGGAPVGAGDDAPGVDEPARRSAIPASPDVVAGEGHAAFAIHVHSYISAYIALADQKAAFLFTAAAAVLAYLGTHPQGRWWSKGVEGWAALDVLACIATLGLLTGTLSALAAVAPRLGGNAGPGIVFWESIAAEASQDAYLRRVAGKTDPDLAAALICHTYDLATSCKAKYAALNLGIWFGAIGLAASVLFLILGG